MRITHIVNWQLGDVKAFQAKVPFKTTEEVDERIR